MSDSYEVVRQRIIERIPNDDDIRESSPIVIAIDPVARELADVTLVELEDTRLQSHPLTADREHLIYEASFMGYTPFDPSAAVAEGKFNVELKMGDRFTIDSLVFAVSGVSPTKEEGYYFYYLTCERTGDIGNVAPGKLIPVVLHPGLTYSYLTRIVINGENEESTEDFRARFRASFNSKAYGGNVADYYEWLAGIQGVGRAKILTCETASGEKKETYVTLVITDSSNHPASPELLSAVKEKIDPIAFEGHGVGLAPITAHVNVTSVKEEVIDLSFEVEHEGASKREQIKEVLEDYFDSQNAGWGCAVCEDAAYYPRTRNNVTVFAAQIIAEILKVPGVVNVKNLKISGASEDKTLVWDTVAKLGDIDETDTTLTT